MCRGPEEHFRLMFQHWIKGCLLVQQEAALNSAEAEYIAASMAACESMWLRKLLVGLFKCELDATVVSL